MSSAALVQVCGATGAAVPPVSGRAVTSQNGSLVVSSLSGRDKTALTKPLEGSEQRSDYLPTWSPDGSQVAFVRWTPEQLSVMVVSSDGSALRRVAALGPRGSEEENRIYNIRWSPDGSQLAYDAGLPNGQSSTEAIEVAAADGSGGRRIALMPKQPFGFFSLFGWTTDSKRVTYSFSVGEPISLHYTGPSRVMTAAADGMDTRKVVTEDSTNDGSWLGRDRLLYTRHCVGIQRVPKPCQLAIFDPASGRSRALTHFKPLTWRDGGQWDDLPFMRRPGGDIVYSHWRKIYEFSPRTRRTRTIHTFRCPRRHCRPLEDDVYLAGISPNGRVALVEFNDDGFERPRDYRLDLKKGALTRIHLVTSDAAEIFLP